MSSLRSSDVLTPRQLAFIAERLPEPPCAPRGRRPYSNLQLLPGILRVLRSGCRWRDLDRPGHSVWRHPLAPAALLASAEGLSPGLAHAAEPPRAGQAPRSLPGQPRRHPDPQSGVHRADGVFRQAPRRRDEAVTARGSGRDSIAVSVAPGNYHDGALGFLTLANIFKPLPILRGILPELPRRLNQPCSRTRATTACASAVCPGSGSGR